MRDIVFFFHAFSHDRFQHFGLHKFSSICVRVCVFFPVVFVTFQETLPTFRLFFAFLFLPSITRHSQISWITSFHLRRLQFSYPVFGSQFLSSFFSVGNRTAEVVMLPRYCSHGQLGGKSCTFLCVDTREKCRACPSCISALSFRACNFMRASLSRRCGDLATLFPFRNMICSSWGSFFLYVSMVSHSLWYVLSPRCIHALP